MSSETNRGATEPTRLARRLGTFDAVAIGLGSMIGAGVFAAFGPAARAAGNGLVLGLVIAAARRVLQCDIVGAARGDLPRVGRCLRLRPEATRAASGAFSRAGAS